MGRLDWYIYRSMEWLIFMVAKYSIHGSYGNKTTPKKNRQKKPEEPQGDSVHSCGSAGFFGFKVSFFSHFSRITQM